MTVLSVENLQAGYSNRIILSEVNFEVMKGEIRVILGGSGCGKTTLLKNIIGLEDPIQGTVMLLEKNIQTLDLEERNKHFHRIGVLFQNGALMGSMTIEENVALPLRLHTDIPEPVIKELVMMKLGLVRLEHALHLYPAELSGGMKKRAALARAMIMDPEILFCDEPSAGLDPLTAAELDDLILHIRDLFGVAVVVVTHELMSIKTIADKILMLSDGRVVFDGPLAAAKVSTMPEVQSFFAREPQPDKQKGQKLTDLLKNHQDQSR
ncbi:ABC transporter ATP-binding protein [candidate division CSSED10-310 bacterium]|uniref:ABC transporter ATP-binding protein n=1 Tax=candidate division CSSED10-310 bacterium TaxID=2855610 RepID=A0ABV6Z6Y3_UNCC1